MKDTEYGCSSIFYTIGIVLAVIVSWTANHSILWVIIHGAFGWAYIIYYAIVYGFS